MTSTYAVAVSAEGIVCLSTSTILAFGFLMVFFFSIVQIVRLWAGGSKLSHRKRVFIRLMACNLLRWTWYTLSSYQLLPEIFDKSSVPDFDFLNEHISYETWEALSHYCYLLPTALLFTSSSWIIINWFQLYRKEKLRQKLDPWNTSPDTTPAERRHKSWVKIKKLRWFHVLTNSVVHVGVVVLAPLSLATDRDNATGILHVMSPEAILALLCGLALISMLFYACRWLANLRLAKKGDSEKLKQHTILALVVSFSLLSYYLFIIVVNFLGVFDPYQDAEGHLLISSGLARTHALLRLYELLHNTLILTILASPSLSSRAPFPAKTSDITQDWLTNVLRENGTIKSTTTVIAFSYESLYGGCHFKVARVHLKYSVEKEDDPHKTVIVKLLYWDKPIYERVLLYCKYLVQSLDREAMYLNSYRIESHFYKRQVYDLTGFHIAETYYNQEDVFNNRFGMVLQDLSRHYDGQPNGFSLEDSRRILAGLAEFHAVNFQQKPENFTGWKRAGYWTGHKREATKSLVARSWERVMENFPEHHLRDRYPALGAILHAKLAYIDEEFELMCRKKFRTLCHGDFKISNLFVKQPTANSPDGKVYVIDWQWFGKGNPAIDAVYFLYTSLREEDLCHIPSLLEYYFSEFKANLPAEKAEAGTYALQQFKHHADVVLVDFCVYTICSKWSVMTLTDFKQYEQKQKDGLHLRSPAHMELIIQDARSVVKKWGLEDRKARCGRQAPSAVSE